MHAITTIVSKIPAGWSNIQCIQIKTSESIALPVYNSLPDMVGEEKEETGQEKREREHRERQVEIDAEPTEEDKEDLEALMKVLFPVKKRKYVGDDKNSGNSRKSSNMDGKKHRIK